MGTDDYRMPAEYQFGYTDLASRRLAEVARVFRPCSVSFLRGAVTVEPRQILDLGCGPGHTTRLLAELFPRASVTGLDISAGFLAEAESHSRPGPSYQRCDVVSELLLQPPADLAYCRYLLSHLQDPLGLVARWGGEVAPCGLVLAEEVETIHPNLPVFQTYLGLVEAMLADQGSRLYVGPALSAAPDPPGMECSFDRVFELPVSRRDAAVMFSMNVPNWKDRPFIRARCTEDEIAALESELQILAGSDGGEPVLWELRQIAWRSVQSRSRQGAVGS